MTQRCWKVLTRALPVVAMLVAFSAGSLHAQATGKVQGFVRDAAGQPIANARVTIPGTAFSAPVNAQGYYFIENIPVGTINLQAQYIQYRPFMVQGIRVQGGQTVNQDFTLEQAPQGLQEIVATAQADNPLVPRDQVTTKQTVDGAMAQRLPVDRIAQVLALQPGVTQVTNCSSNGTNSAQNAGSGNPVGGCTPLISVRGGRVDQNAVYIDGVPVNPGIHTGTGTANGGTITGGAPQIQVATNGFEEASITTGASSASQGNAQGGIINIATRTGGNKFAGNLSYETGMLGLANYGQGVNIFAGSVSGPITHGLTFFASGRVEGNNSTNGGNHGWLFPGYAAVGIDTTYRVPAPNKAGTAAVVDSVDVPVYNYAVVEGGCDPNNLGNGVVAYQSSTFAPIANNYGQTCHANQGYTAPTTNYFTTDKLNYSFGQGSRIALSYIFSGNQQRGTLADGSNSGTISGANVATLNWSQTLIRQATHQLTLDAYVSRQWSNLTTSRLTAESEAATRNSPLGIITHKLQFRYNQSDYPIDSTLIYNVLTNASGHRVGGLTDPKVTGQYNGLAAFTTNRPPDGIAYAAGGGGGDDNAINYSNESRWLGKADLDFQADRYNRLKFGGEYTAFDIANYTGNSTGQNIYQGKPVSYDAYAEDRLDLGDVVVVGGLRYDYYWSKAWRWNEFPEISTRPNFSRDSIFCPVGTTPSATAACALVQDPSHNYISPHIQVAFPVTEKTNFRLSYAQNVQAPDFGLIYTNSLSDIASSGQNSRSRWGQDLDFGKTVQFEFGARHAFSSDMVLDVAVYNNDIVADPAFGYEHPIDPRTGQPTILYLVENTDFGNTRGIDVRMDRRIGNYFNGSLTYSFQDAKNTGTDPTSYLGFFEPLAGFTGNPPTAALPTGTSRPHSLTGLFVVQLPGDWKKGSVLGDIFGRVGFYVTGRIASGLPYTRCDPTDVSSIGVIAGNGNTGNCGSLGSVNGFNAARLPMLKQLDLRITKDFKIGRYSFTGYLDGRNILNLTNVVSVYAQTGTTTSGAAATLHYQTDSATFANYAKAVGEYDAATGNINLPSTIAGCGKVVSGGNSFAPECYYYIRSEQRFGNGDGVYTLAEQKVASNANRALSNSIWNFVTGARTIRFGLEVNF